MSAGDSAPRCRDGQAACSRHEAAAHRLRRGGRRRRRRRRSRRLRRRWCGRRLRRNARRSGRNGSQRALSTPERVLGEYAEVVGRIGDERRELERPVQGLGARGVHLTVSGGAERGAEAPLDPSLRKKCSVCDPERDRRAAKAVVDVDRRWRLDHRRRCRRQRRELAVFAVVVGERPREQPFADDDPEVVSRAGLEPRTQSRRVGARRKAEPRRLGTVGRRRPAFEPPFPPLVAAERASKIRRKMAHRRGRQGRRRGRSMCRPREGESEHEAPERGGSETAAYRRTRGGGGSHRTVVGPNGAATLVRAISYIRSGASTPMRSRERASTLFVAITRPRRNACWSLSSTR
jgi:hypothetical protein